MTAARHPDRQIPTWTLPDRLRKIRRDVLGVEQREFARRVGVTPQAYAAWEAGRNRPRDLVAFAQRIELLTGVPATWVLGLDEATAAATQRGAAAPESITTGDLAGGSGPGGVNRH